MIFGKSNHVKWVYLILLAITCTIPSLAQNNEYQIDDSLYEIFVQANKVRYTPEALGYADKMFNKAVELGDKKAQCVALTIPVNYYASTTDEESLQKAVSNCQNMARENSYLQYYYFASSAHITWLLRRMLLLRAMQTSKTMLDQALNDHDDYGVLQSYRMQGHIYTLRQCFDLAIERYSKALEYMLEHQPDQDPTSLYVQLADCYIRKGTSFYNIALDNIEKGLSVSKTHNSRMQALITKCRLAFLMKQHEEFNSIYRTCIKEMSENGMVHKRQMQELDIYNYAIHNSTDKALALADSVFTGYDSIRIKEVIASNYGDYKTAYEHAVGRTFYKDSVLQNIQISDIEGINAEMNLMRIEQQNEQLKTSQYFMLVIAFLLLVVVLVLFYLFYKKNKYNTALREQNEELDKAREKAEMANQMKDAFIHNMSHEIRTPLNAIVGFAQIITMPDLPLEPEEKEQYKNLICHNADLLTTLVNDILDLAALESGKYSINKQPFYCNELCQMTIASVKHRCPSNVNLYFTTTISDDFRIISDEKRIRQVLINFLSNALKHTEQGEIHLHTTLTDDAERIVFSVTDTGPGIPADKIPVLFDRFVKLNTNKPGTGLGLNICRVIANLLGGEVSFDNTYTNGSRFIFTLPLGDAVSAG